jgi:hypothetical protein
MEDSVPWYYLAQVENSVTQVKLLERCCICRFCYLSSILQRSDMCHLAECFLIIRIKTVIAHYTTQMDDHIKQIMSVK